MECMYGESKVCSGKASGLYCYIKKGEYHPRVEFCCDSCITNSYQRGMITTLVVWNCGKQLERFERWTWLRNWLLKRWMKKMKKNFIDSLQSYDIATYFNAVESYNQLMKTVKF